MFYDLLNVPPAQLAVCNQRDVRDFTQWKLVAKVCGLMEYI